MDDLNAFLARLYQNLQILQEREAKYLGDAPLSLLNQIADYRTAIRLTEQTRTGGLSQVELEAELARLNLELPPGPSLPPVIPALHQLPAPPADFTGRIAELNRLTAAIAQGGATISGLRGLGGIGKTALILKLAEVLAPAYPDAQFYLDLRGASPTPLTSAEALAHVIRAYHPTAKLPDSETELAGLYRSALHGQRALLLMDNAASAAQVTPLLPPPGCLLLVTSRQHFTLPGLYAENLDALPPEDARELLLKIAPCLGSPRPVGEGPGVRVDSLAALCGYLPLALRLAASALTERPDLSLETYLRRLTKAQKRLELIEASLSLSYELLNPILQQWWGMLFVFPADFDLPAAATVWNLDPDAADEPIGELLKYSLVEYGQVPGTPGRGESGDEGRYFLHDLARLYAASRLEPAARAEAELHHAEHYLAVLSTANQLYLQGGDNITRGLALFDREWSNIEAGQAWAANHATVNDTAAYLCSYYPYTGASLLYMREYPQGRVQWQESALVSAQRLQNRGLEGGILTNLGRTYAELGQNYRAIECYQQSLAISREIGNQYGESVVLGNLGDAYAELGETRRAIELYEQRLAIGRKIGNRREEGNALGNLGLAYHNLGELHRAIEYHDQYLAISREIGAWWGEADALWNKALTLDKLGERAQAIACAASALKIKEEIEDLWAEMVRAQLAQWRGENQ